MSTGSGLLPRRKPETHKRLMLLATLGILTAAIAGTPQWMAFARWLTG